MDRDGFPQLISRVFPTLGILAPPRPFVSLVTLLEGGAPFPSCFSLKGPCFAVGTMNLESTFYSIQSVFHPPMYPLHRVPRRPVVIDQKWHSFQPGSFTSRAENSHGRKPHDESLLGSSSSLTSKSLFDDDDEDQELFVIENITSMGSAGATPFSSESFRSKFLRGRNPFLACSCPSASEQWNALYRRFSSHKKTSCQLSDHSSPSVGKSSSRSASVPLARSPPPPGTAAASSSLSRLATRMLSDCTRVVQYPNGSVVVSDEGMDYREVPLPEGLASVWKDYREEEQCRVNLTA